tara:strand:- start:292 stop:510 length:219 start_codon:yes stop_codon:yes gene_type:complete
MSTESKTFCNGEIVGIKTSAIDPFQKNGNCMTFGKVVEVFYEVEFSHYVDGKQVAEERKFLAKDLVKQNPKA